MFAKFINDMNLSVNPILTIVASICFLNIYSLTEAQTNHNLGDWNVLILKGKISPRFSFIEEGHLRNESYNLKYDYFRD